MYIEKVSYRKNFNISQFIFENIEVSVVLNEGENAIEALDTARQLVDEYHLKNNGDIYAMRGTVERIIQPVIMEQKVPDAITSTLEEIEKCKDMTELGTLWLVSKGNLTLSSAYKTKEKQLKNA